MKERRVNSIIICCLVIALVILIPLTGVVADAAIKADVVPNVGPNHDANDTISGSTPDVAPDNTPDDVPVKNPTIEDVKYFVGKTLSFERGMEMIFYVDADLLNGFTNIKMEFAKSIFGEDGAIISEDVVEITDYTLSNISGKNVLRFVYNGIFAKEMSVAIDANLYEGSNCLATTTFSVVQYAHKMLSNSSAKSELKTFLVDLLNYGSAAQVYFDYNTENLANAGLTDEQKAYATADVASVESIKEKIESAEDEVRVQGVSLSLVNTIDAHIRFDLYNRTTADVYATIDYIDIHGENKTMTIDGNDFESLVGLENKYFIVFSEYGVTQMGDAFTVKFYDKATDEAIGDTFTYSIESYLARALEKANNQALVDILEAMIKYGNSAEIYFE
ncbi:MAG: hypothetical protein IKA59_03825 [Clostridia bacterium]|nr:hypothetical protein [Clostridia bacterium]